MENNIIIKFKDTKTLDSKNDTLTVGDIIDISSTLPMSTSQICQIVAVTARVMVDFELERHDPKCKCGELVLLKGLKEGILNAFRLANESISN